MSRLCAILCSPPDSKRFLEVHQLDDGLTIEFVSPVPYWAEDDTPWQSTVMHRWIWRNDGGQFGRGAITATAFCDPIRFIERTCLALLSCFASNRISFAVTVLAVSY